MIKNSIIYIISGALNALIPLILMPYLTKSLTPNDYGLINLFSIIQLFLAPLLAFSSSSAISRQYFNRDINFPVYLTNCIYLLFVSVLIIVGIYACFKSILLSVLQLNEFLCLIVLVTSLAQFFFTIRLLIFQASQNALKFLVFQLLNVTLNIFLTYLLIESFHLGRDGRLYAICLSSILLSVFSWISLYRDGLINFKFNNLYLRDALVYSFPLIFHSISGILMGMSDRFLISKVISLEATGIYSVAFQFAAAINLLTTGVNNAFVPWLFNKLSESDFDKRIIVRYTYGFYIILTILFLIYFYLQKSINKILLLFISNEYSDSLQLILPLFLACIFNAMYLSVTNYLFFLKKTYLLSIITVSVGLFNVFLTYFLLNKFGLIGASSSMCVSYFLLFVIVFIIVYIKYPLLCFLNSKFNLFESKTRE